MGDGIWSRMRTGRARRFFSAYLALVLLTAIVGPGLAVYGAEGEGTIAPLAEADALAPVGVEKAPAPAADPEGHAPAVPVEDPAAGAMPRVAEPAVESQVPQAQTGCLVIRKFQDLDADGSWDSDEPTLAGWEFRVYDAHDVQVGMGMTDSNGWLRFTGLAEGCVRVAETPRSGWTNTTPLVREATIVAASTTTLYFGNVPCVEAPETGNLIIRKFEDLDEDGVWDEGEPVLGGWVFTIYDSEGAQIDSGLTDENGWLMFDGLAEGDVTVVETLKPGWTNTTPLSQDVTIVAGASAHLCFGNARQVAAPETGDLVIRKFEDLDEDGAWDEGEPVLGGWDFTVYNDMDVQIASGTTDDNGWLMFGGLPEGEVTVIETLESGWTNTTPLSQSIMIVGGQTAFLYFGNIADVLAPETGSAIIHKFGDSNRNGVMDVGELPLSGWSFVVRDSAGAVVASGSTNTAGDLSFELPVGVYTVTETLVAGWANTTALTQGFTIVAGETQHVYFGNVESFLPFTPGVETASPVVRRAPSAPFLPFTGGEYLTLVIAAIASSVAGIALRRKPRQ